MASTTRPMQLASRIGSSHTADTDDRRVWFVRSGGRVGFTLIELLVVITIIAAVAAIVLPTMSRRAACSSRDDVADLLDVAVAEAKARSARSGAPVSICLRDDEPGKVLVVVSDGPSKGSVSAGEQKEESGASGDEQVVGVIRQGKPTAAESEKPEAGGETSLAVVTPDGSVHPGDSGQVRVGSEGERCKVRVDSFGGVHVGERRASADDEFEGESDGKQIGFDESGLDEPGFAEPAEDGVVTGP